MSEVVCKTRKIGGPIGIVLPKEFVQKEEIKPDQEIRVEIKFVK